MRWIIGDIHGMHRMLVALLEAVRQRDPAARFYFVGDYVNRGPDSNKVVELLLTLPDARFARGNHDEIFDLVINNKSFESHPEIDAGLHALLTFLPYGLVSTLTSYGVDLAAIQHIAQRPSPDALAKLIEPIPTEHRRFFRTLPATIEEPDLLVAHAKWHPDLPNDEPTIQRGLADQGHRHSIVWGRYVEHEIRRNKPWTRLACFGHTPVATYATGRTRDPHAPIAGPKIMLLDSGAALSIQGRLTAYCADNHAYVQVNRAYEVLEGTSKSL